MSSIQEIKALVTSSEHEVHIAKEALKATERGIEEAYERNRIAKGTHDGLVVKLANLKAQFREQIMEDGLKESNRWNEMYYKLLQWKENHDGDVLVGVDKDSDEDTKKLSRWVINQRSAYKYFMNGDTKHIKDHRIDALNKMGFVWCVADHVFQANVEELKQYHAENEKFDIPVKENKKLAAFVSRVRTAYANKQEGRAQHDLTDEKIEQLDAIGFKWGFKKSRKKTSSTSTAFDYDTQIALLQEFKNEYGHTKVNKLIKEWQKGEGEPSKKEYRRLPVFLTFARKEYISYVEGQPSLIDAEKVKALTDLGVEWKQPPNVPRKNTGGEASRKKKPRIEAPSHEQEFVAAELDVEAEMPPLAANLHVPALPSPNIVAPKFDDGQSTMI
mmetsp:Transcript_10749/g.16237  ORF Transcript_10749/g.16237 Transcript_10749/m.16237 type:complete len:387 (+) Transcript_10749:120-1280(+)